MTARFSGPDRAGVVSSRRTKVALSIVCLALLAVAASEFRVAQARRALPVPAAGDPVARGSYLVHSIGCSDCHSPWVVGPEGPHPDPQRFLAGHPSDLELEMPELDEASPWQIYMSASGTAFAGPWGISFAANLTPDENTGLGIWTEDMFVRALREGRHFGQSRPILPPMPWHAYRNLSDDDLRAVFAYLRTIPPHTNRVPEPHVPGASDDPWAN